jgi:mannose-6-phosphate isomerase-like protein (cupin superfamily)
MNTPSRYAIDLNIAHGFLSLIDVDKIREAVTDDWFNQTLCEVNDCVVRLGVVQGEFHWHKHDNEDEFFFVVDGKLIIDLEGRSVELVRNQGFTVPKGVMHRTRAPMRTAMLMIEGRTVTPTGDA